MVGRAAFRALALAIAVTWFVGCGGGGTPSQEAGTSPPAADIDDGRTPIALPAQARGEVIHEMHLMMGALQGMLAGLARQDREALAEAAVGGGVGNAVDRDPALAGALPEEFASLGMNTHTSFDDIAARARAGAPFDSVAAAMAELLAKCNRCHSQYKLVAESS